MYTLNRKLKIKNYFKNTYNISSYFVTNILEYVNIDKIDNVEENEFEVKNNERYLLTFQNSSYKSMNKIFNPRYKYIILSDRPHRCKALFNQYDYKGIFMNTLTEKINYNKLNQKLLLEIKNNQYILIINCRNVDPEKIKNLNIPIFVKLTSIGNFSPIKPEIYDKIIMKMEPWSFYSLCRNDLFDEKLRHQLMNFMDKECNNKFLMIDNKNLDKSKFSRLFYIK